MRKKRIFALCAALCVLLQCASPLHFSAAENVADVAETSEGVADVEETSEGVADIAETSEGVADVSRTPESVTETADFAGDAQEAPFGTPEAELFAPDIVASGKCGADGDNVTWTLDSAGTLTISGAGKMRDYADYEDVPWIGNERIPSRRIRFRTA